MVPYQYSVRDILLYLNQLLPQGNAGPSDKQ